MENIFLKPLSFRRGVGVRSSVHNRIHQALSLFIPYRSRILFATDVLCTSSAPS